MQGTYENEVAWLATLIASRTPEGKTKAEVKKLLGEPDFQDKQHLTFRYKVDIGYRWVFEPVVYYLSIYWDKSDRVYAVDFFRRVDA